VSSNIVTPAQVEKRLYDLSKLVDEAHEYFATTEHKYQSTKAEYEIAMAKSKIKNSHPDLKMTVALGEATAIVENQDLRRALAIAEAEVKAAKENSNRIRTQVDIARSISVSVRASMEV
jgi:hypothetical protein